jgi:hypothetical protein
MATSICKALLKNDGMGFLKLFIVNCEIQVTHNQRIAKDRKDSIADNAMLDTTIFQSPDIQRCETGSIWTTFAEVALL